MKNFNKESSDRSKKGVYLRTLLHKCRVGVGIVGLSISLSACETGNPLEILGDQYMVDAPVLYGKREIV